jgi:hypothetical protein
LAHRAVRAAATYARLAWFDDKLFPAWKVWRAANPGEIVVSRLLRGGYHQ